MAEINVTNLVDVVLVLLIIFMIAAPMIQSGVDIQLPKSSEAPRDVSTGIVVSITKDKAILIDNYKIEMKDFESRLKTIRDVKKYRPVYIRADERVPYGMVMEIMAKIKNLGIDNVGLVTEPEKTL
ncbi:MAG: biopolymer transporter ExbD [candidate division Zixibacteria bacterium]|jgi:biopolymer transport protein ExbD|nr:biopolymer transporter ExbD [candidate division Zixibacteria bacterium]